MAKLWIANVTKQTQKIYFTLDFDKTGNFKANQRATFQEILPGRQAPLGGDLHQSQLISIVDQLVKVGMVKHDEISRVRHLVPYIYSEDKPVTDAAVNRVYRHNMGMLEDRGRTQRSNSAIAVDAAIEKAVSDASRRAQTVVEFEQVEQTQAGEKRIEEGYIVPNPSRGGGGAEAAPKGKRR